MRQYLTPKRLFFGSLGLAGILLLLTYLASIRKTFQVAAELARVEQENAELIQLKSTSQNALGSFSNRLSRGSYQANQQAMLDYLTQTCQGIRKLTVHGVQEPHRYNDGELAIETYIFEVKGPYASTLFLLDSVYHQTPGMLKSVLFEKKKPTYNAKSQLHTTLFFQQVGS